MFKLLTVPKKKKIHKRSRKLISCDRASEQAFKESKHLLSVLFVTSEYRSSLRRNNEQTNLTYAKLVEQVPTVRYKIK